MASGPSSGSWVARWSRSIKLMKAGPS